MSVLMNFIEFLYNNLITVTIVLGATLVIVIVFRQFYREYRLNKQLFKKKALLRNIERFKFKKSNRKMATIALPVILLGLFVGSNFSGLPTYDEHIMRFESEQNISDIHSQFNSKFYSTPIASTEPSSFTALGINRVAADTVTTAFDNIDFVTNTEDEIFVLNQDGVDIYTYLDTAINHRHTLTFNQPDDYCLKRSNPEGLMVYADKIVVVQSHENNSCDNDMQAMHSKTHITTISIFENARNYQLLDTYQVSGLLNAMYFDDSGSVHLSVKKYIPFEDAVVSLENHLPNIKHQGTTYRSALTDIVYAEGVKPNSFSSIFSINLNNRVVDVETLLTDFNHKVELTNQNAVVAAKSYEFLTASNMFEMKNPVQKENSAITLFNINNSIVTYNHTQIIPGALELVSKLDQSSEFITVTNDSDGYHVMHFSDQLALLDKHTVELQDNDSILKHGSNLQFIPKNNQDDVWVVELTSTGIKEYSIRYDQSYRFNYSLSDHRSVGINIVDHRYMQLHLLDISNKEAPLVLDDLFIDYLYLDANLINDYIIIDNDMLMVLFNARPEGVSSLGMSHYRLNVYAISDRLLEVEVINLDNDIFIPFMHRMIRLEDSLIRVTPYNIQNIYKFND